jgi:hypothetical protein
MQLNRGACRTEKEGAAMSRFLVTDEEVSVGHHVSLHLDQNWKQPDQSRPS